jgi:ribonuclease P protein component
VRRRHRLSGRRQFAAVRAERNSASSGALRVNLAANGFAHARIGFVVPKAVGGAVVRNTVRRRLRAALQPHAERLAGYDVVVATGAAAALQSYAELAADLDRCLARVLAQARSRPGGAAGPRLADNEPTAPGPRRAPAPTYA